MPFVAAQSVFYYLAAASVATAILAVTRRNPVHSMLWVLALFLHVAGIFLLTGAEFLAAVQVIVYAGAILVFYLFFLMLLDLPSEQAGQPFGAHWPLCTAAGLVFAALILYAREPSFAPAAASDTPVRSGASGNVAAIGTLLFGQFALAFEIVSLVLLAAMVGAIVVARRKTEP
jgi:NADH-quinone oxidoreductase subunit J